MVSPMLMGECATWIRCCKTSAIWKKWQISSSPTSSYKTLLTVRMLILWRQCGSLQIRSASIQSYFPTFKGRQQDCEEFLLSFLGALQNDDVTKLFQGELSTITRCESCGTKTEREDEFLDLSLPIPAAANVTLENCLDKLTKRTKLVAENKIHCARCGGPRIASQRSVFSKLPNHLIVHLKRSKNEGGRVKKIETHVEVPVSLSMGKYLFRNERSYNLTGGIIHHGRMAGSGHCTAFVKKKSSWYCCNDNHVNPVSLDTVLKSQFYVMFYSYDGLWLFKVDNRLSCFKQENEFRNLFNHYQNN